MRIVITDHPFQTLDITRSILSRHGVDFEVLSARDQATVIAGAKNAEAIIVGMARFDKKVIDSLEKCKGIVRLGVGFDHIDVTAATARGIMVMNVPDISTEEVSDHTMALFLMIARRVSHGQKVVGEGKWGSKAIDFTSFKRVREQALGLYGFGHIARRVAEKARGFNVTCLACDPFVSAEVMASAGVEKVSINELLIRSDFLSLHSPLTEETENAFGLEQFRIMKPTAWIINTSRGQVIQEAGLIQALDDKLIAGAALDVLAKEPPERNHPLMNRENVIITPHMASWTESSRDDLQTAGAGRSRTGIERCCAEERCEPGGIVAGTLALLIIACCKRTIWEMNSV